MFPLMPLFMILSCFFHFPFRSYDRAVALRRMEKAGAVITTTESILFELLGTVESPKFKALSLRLKARNANGPDEFASKTEL